LNPTPHTVPVDTVTRRNTDKCIIRQLAPWARVRRSLCVCEMMTVIVECSLGSPPRSADLQNHMITQQNKELDDLAASVDHGHDKLKATNKRVEKQLK
jgi:hypothetical protein